MSCRDNLGTSPEDYKGVNKKSGCGSWVRAPKLVPRFKLDNSKARFKRRISHVPNLTRELNACEVRRLNQLNSTV